MKLATLIMASAIFISLTACQTTHVSEGNESADDGHTLKVEFGKGSRLVRRDVYLIDNFRGHAVEARAECEVQSKKQGCVDLRVQQTVEAQGSYAFESFVDNSSAPAFAGVEVNALIKIRFFCAYTSSGSLPRNLGDALKSCGEQYSFKTETLQAEETRRQKEDRELEDLQAELDQISPGDPKRDEVALTRNIRQQARERFRTLDESVFMRLVAKYGEPDNHQWTGHIRIESEDGQVISARPNRPYYVVYHWHAPAHGHVMPINDTAITMSCELGLSGWCTVLVVNRTVYGFAFARDTASGGGWWLWQLLTESGHQLGQPDARRRRDCRNGSQCTLIAHGMSKSDLARFDIQRTGSHQASLARLEVPDAIAK